MRIFLISWLLGLQIAQAQIFEELVYPIIPIRDDCHFLFDDTSRVSTITKYEFQQLEKLWATYDYCIEQKKDTLFILEFDVVLENIMGEVFGIFIGNNGHLKSEHQSVLNDAIANIRSFTKVHIQNAKFEKDGAMHQVPSFTFIIDSTLHPQIDTCFSFFNLPQTNQNLISKDSLNQLFQENFCYNKCTGIYAWPDNESFTLLIISKYIEYEVESANTYEVVYSRLLNDNKLPNQVIQELQKLKMNDLVVLDYLLYKQNGRYYATKGWRFKITN